MKLDISRRGETLVVRMTRRLDPSIDTQLLRDSIVSLLDTKGLSNLVVCFTADTLVWSRLISSLIGIHRQACRRGVTLILVHPERRMAGMLRAMGLEKVIGVCVSERDATSRLS